MIEINDKNLLKFTELRKKVQDFHVGKYRSDIPEHFFACCLELQFVYPTDFHHTEILEESYVDICLKSNVLLPNRISECHWNASTFELALYKAEQDINTMIEKQKDKDRKAFFSK